MQKNLILFITIICSLFLIGYVVKPKVDYSKIKSNIHLGYKSQNLGTEEESEKEDSVVMVQLLLEYDHFNKKENSVKYTSSDYQETKKEYRKDAKEYHKGNNNSIIESIDFGNYQDLYVSTYSPFIDVIYDYNYFMSHKDSLLANLTENKLVKEVVLTEEKNEYESLLDYSISACDVEDVYNNRTKTGSGVVVGILEAGVIKTNNELLQNTNITIRTSAYNITGRSDHSTTMAQIIAGSTGIAPGASLLNAYLSYSMNDEIDWMLDNEVDIINMSFGEINRGSYSTKSAYADYIAYTYDVILVAAAGNYGESDALVCNPGLGYNVITVGSCDGAAYIHNYSSYNTNNGPIKPTVCTPGAGVYITEDADESTSGTSNSTAICSGLIALLLEDYPSLATDKAKLLALITVNAKFGRYNDFDRANGFDRYVGAGLFSYQNIIDNYNTAFIYTNTSGQADSRFRTRQVYLREGQTIRVSFAHLAKADGTTDGTVFTDYDLYIKDTAEEIYASYVDMSTNIMLATFVAPATGYYRIEIRQYSEMMDTNDKTCLAYRILN